MASLPSFFRLRRLEETASTNDVAKNAAEAGEAEGLVIQALRQTAGRGRQGRAWDSPEGNLYASILLRPHCPPREAGLYAFVTALAVYDTVGSFLPNVGLKLKWPNDVLVNDKKISGALLEASPAEKGVVEWLVIGIGINVKRHPENALYPATSLTAEGARHPPLAGGSKSPGLDPGNFGEGLNADIVLATLLESLERWRNLYVREGFGPVRAAWLTRAQTGPMAVRLPEETVEGSFHDLDGNGRLILRLPDGTERAIAAGDVFFPS